MKKFRTRTAVINAVLSADKRAHVQVRDSKIVAQLFSADAYLSLQDEVDLPVISKSMESSHIPAYPRAMIVWDCARIRDAEEERVQHYKLEDSPAQERTKSVVEQEEDAAALIGGRRHAGSGAIDGLKSDGSGKFFQTESKQTSALSMSLSLSVLNKINRESKDTMKIPMLHVRFKKVPVDMSVPEDWVVIPAHVFGRMVKLCGWK